MHGSEAYYVVGEGLLSEANQDGAGPAATLAVAAAAAPRSASRAWRRRAPSSAIPRARSSPSP